MNRCKGCGALMVVTAGRTPDECHVFHPDPLCAYVLELLAGGIATGPITRAQLNTGTGEIIDDDTGGSN